MNINDFKRFYNKLPASLNQELLQHIKDYFTLLKAVNKPMVSVVIPIYSAKETLLAHIISLSRLRTIMPYEVIFIDNNADQQSLSILSTLGALVVKETTQGITPARQKGLEIAKGEVLISMDPDTLYAPDYLDKMALPFFYNKSLVLTYTIPKNYINAFDCSVKFRLRNMAKIAVFKTKNVLFNEKKQLKYLRASCIAVRLSTYKNIGYRTDLRAVSGCDDGILAVDLYNHGTFMYVPNNVYTQLPLDKGAGAHYPYCNKKYLSIQ